MTLIKLLCIILATALASASLPAFAKTVPQASSATSQSGSAPTTPGSLKTVGPSPAKQKSTERTDEGSRIFEQNCSRCHNAPEGFSPSISGAVVRHMRVRANLSQHDEQELLRFFNP